MNAIALCFGGALNAWAFEPVFDGVCAFQRSLEQAAAFPGVTKLVLLAREDFDEQRLPRLPAPLSLVRAASWNTRGFLDALSRSSEGFDLAYVVWADCPFLDAGLAGALRARHTAFPAEYTYADGWPYGLAPELFAPGVLGVLSRLNGGAEEPVCRDTLFTVLQKDINAFDIETEIAPADLRSRRVFLCADSKRNLLLLRRFREQGFASYPDAEHVIARAPHILRTLPAYIATQVSAACPQRCGVCPYPRYGGGAADGGVMAADAFDALMGRVADFTGDAVIGISLWGEPALHPAVADLAASVLSRPQLSLLIETSGLGWKEADLDAISRAAEKRGQSGGTDALWWVVSLDAATPEAYRRTRGEGFEEAVLFARALLERFPRAAYVQAVRCSGGEDDIERFYKQWKEKTDNVIIQKYDSFCGKLPALLAADISPVTREPCWHLARDMYILRDGRTLACREDVAGISGEPEMELLGSAFTEELATLWERGEGRYRAHCKNEWQGLCASCDEYYTFNF